MTKNFTFIETDEKLVRLSFDKRSIPNGVAVGLSVNNNGHTLHPKHDDRYMYNFYYFTVLLFKIKLSVCLTLGKLK